MGLIQALGYEVRKPTAAQVAMQHVAASSAAAWVFARTLNDMDRLLLAVSRGRLTVPALVAGLPVLTLTTTGARTGQRRPTPLTGVPSGDDIAIVGTNFGQARMPGWYYNLHANPAAEVTYRNRTVSAVARDADEAEWQAIWDRAAQIYLGYQAYQTRITTRQIPIMILSEPSNG